MDLWLTESEIRVMLHDGENGYDRDIILAVARTASGARQNKTKAILKQLEAMDT